jgi:hypothetical protein
MHLQIVMDTSGDTRHQFDPADASAVAEAEKRFRELVEAGFIAAKRTGNGTSELVRQFDRCARSMLSGCGRSRTERASSHCSPRTSEKADGYEAGARTAAPRRARAGTISRVDEEPNDSGRRHDFMQQLEPLCPDFDV